MHRIIGICSLLLAFHAGADWQLVCKHDDKQGNPVAGNKLQLLNAIRSGADIRIGWGVEREPGISVEHTATPEFLTITNGEQVFVQIAEHIAQTSYWNNDLQDFNSPEQVWKGLFSTTGRFMAVWYNRSSGDTIRRYPQRVPISWFADMPDKNSDTAEPLFNASVSREH